MAEKCISQHKRLASGEVPNKYAKGGMVQPRKAKCGCNDKDADGMKCGGKAKKGAKK